MDGNGNHGLLYTILIVVIGGALLAGIKRVLDTIFVSRHKADMERQADRIRRLECRLKEAEEANRGLAADLKADLDAAVEPLSRRLQRIEDAPASFWRNGPAGGDWR